MYGSVAKIQEDEHQFVREVIYELDVCKTAPAILGLLIITLLPKLPLWLNGHVLKLDGVAPLMTDPSQTRSHTMPNQKVDTNIYII